MRTTSHVMAVLACVAGAAGSVYQASTIAPAGEPLIVDEVSRHLGSIRQGGEAQTAFRLRNDSRSNVEILSVEPTCGCTAVGIGRQKLAPGESTELTATLHADASRGLKTTRIDIRHRVAGEAVESNLALELSADVTPHYAVRPAVLTFDPQHRERTITLSPNFGPDVEVLSASCPHPAFDVEISADSGSGTRTISIRFDPSRWADGFLCPRVMLLTSSPYQPQCSLLVSVAASDHWGEE